MMGTVTGPLAALKPDQVPEAHATQDGPSKSSGLLTSDVAVKASRGLLCDVTVIPAGADSTAIIYDNATTGAGTILAKVKAAASGASVTVTFDPPRNATNGLFLDISGASAECVVGYK